ncbi:MAG: hypothetical protein ACO1SV_07865 [Fimbriimonas sp.]
MGLHVRKFRLPETLSRAFVGVLWLAAVGGTMGAALQYETTPGRAGTAAASVAKGHELIVVVHPQCPCTAASLKAIRSLVAQATVPVRVHLKIVAYEREPGPPSKQPYAAALPEADAAWITAAEAEKRYGAYTSGHIVAYRNGVPVLTGGITAGRGVEGLSQAQLNLREFLNGKGNPSSAPVFGCALSEESR